MMMKSEDFHPSVIQNNLKVALMEAEEESEQMVEQFLESEPRSFYKITPSPVLPPYKITSYLSCPDIKSHSTCSSYI